MRDIVKALRHLNVSNWSLDYEPKNEAEFKEAFGINILDSDGAPTSFSRDSADFPVTWNQLVQADDLIALREERNKVIAKTDWRALNDLTLDSDWRIYRQSLRDITETYSSLDSAIWPEEPSS